MMPLQIHISKFPQILLLLLISFAFVQSSQASSPVYNVRDYGAVGDGQANDTPAINKAIEAASAVGGGTVLLPAGTYYSGTVWLKNNITLQLDSGAVLKAATRKSGLFGAPEPRINEYQDFGHSTWSNGLIVGIECENIAIIGQGKIDGKSMGSDPPPGGGGKAIALKLCRNVTIRDITIDKSGHFAILPTGCDNMTIDNLRIDSSRDGVNLDCCRNVRMSNCTINSPDDGICLKSSYALGYARATENITITNCLVSGYTEGSVLSGEFKDEGPYFAKGGAVDGVGTPGGGSIKRIGRIKFGTESNGGFRNITISNCVFDKCWGLALETVDGAILDNVSISNIAMRDIADGPILIRLGNRARGPEGTVPGVARNITISNLTATVKGNRYGCIIAGLKDHPVENVTLSNINITCAGGGSVKDAEREIPENERGGPEPTMFGDMPSYGLFARHVKGLKLHNVRIETRKPDLRPAIVAEDVDGLQIRSLNLNRAKGAKKSIMLKDVRNKDIERMKPL